MTFRWTVRLAEDGHQFTWSADHVCGIHARVVRNYGGVTVLDGIYDKNGAR